MVTQTGDRVRIVGSGGDGGFSNGFRKPKFTDIVNEYMGVCFEEHCTIGESSDEAASLVTFKSALWFTPPAERKTGLPLPCVY